jgi:hypothetical protein
LAGEEESLLGGVVRRGDGRAVRGARADG